MESSYSKCLLKIYFSIGLLILANFQYSSKQFLSAIFTLHCDASPQLWNNKTMVVYDNLAYFYVINFKEWLIQILSIDYLIYC